MNHAQLLSFAVIVGSALVMIALERRFPYNKGQKLLREGFWLDFFPYNLFQTYVLGLVIAWIIARLDSLAGGGLEISRSQLISHWPLWAQLALFLVTHDLYIYWFHRLQHTYKPLWRTHEAHHSVPDVDFLSGARSHPLEILINQTIEFAPIVLLGAAPEVAIWKGTLSAVWGMWIHSNIGVYTGWMQYLINGPEMHRWHHADKPEVYHANFATKFAFWDWIFGSAYLPDPRVLKASDYGLRKRVRPIYPKGYWGQTFFAFRPIDAEEKLETQETKIPGESLWTRKPRREILDPCIGSSSSSPDSSKPVGLTS